MKCYVRMVRSILFVVSINSPTDKVGSHVDSELAYCAKFIEPCAFEKIRHSILIRFF